MLSEHKKAVLRDRNYVYLDGKWRHKGDAPSIADFAVQILGDPEFAASMDRYVDAKVRNIHQVHLGEQLFHFEE